MELEGGLLRYRDVLGLEFRLYRFGVGGFPGFWLFGGLCAVYWFGLLG